MRGKFYAIPSGEYREGRDGIKGEGEMKEGEEGKGNRGNTYIYKSVFVVAINNIYKPICVW